MEPQVGPTSKDSMKSFKALSDCLERGPSMVGATIRIERDLVRSGPNEIMALNERMIGTLGHKKPRVILGYCILYYFTEKVQ